MGVATQILGSSLQSYLQSIDSHRNTMKLERTLKAQKMLGFLLNPYYLVVTFPTTFPLV